MVTKILYEFSCTRVEHPGRGTRRFYVFFLKDVSISCSFGKGNHSRFEFYPPPPRISGCEIASSKSWYWVNLKKSTLSNSAFQTFEIEFQKYPFLELWKHAGEIIILFSNILLQFYFWPQKMSQDIFSSFFFFSKTKRISFKWVNVTWCPPSI